MASSPRIERAGPAVADIYLDACCFIYLVGSRVGGLSSRNGSAISNRPRGLSRRSSRGSSAARSQRAMVTECLLRRYDMLFGAGRVVVLDVSAEVIDRATDLPARYGFKTPDAIHLATAIESAATEFWTGDAGIVDGSLQHARRGGARASSTRRCFGVVSPR